MGLSLKKCFKLNISREIMNQYNKLLDYLFSEKLDIQHSTLKSIGKKAVAGDPLAKQILANCTYFGNFSINPSSPASVRKFADS